MQEQCPSPDVLWYVLRLDDNRVRAADAKGLQLIHKNFGDTIWNRTMTVFTHSDKVSSPEKFHKSFDARAKNVNDIIAQITEGKSQGVPSVAVANKHECTPDGESWLGELFTTSLEKLNPERLAAFFLAFVKDLEIPEPQQNNTRKATTKGIEKTEKRIKLTEKQVIRVEKSVDASLIAGLASVGATVGIQIDLATGGATLGLATVAGALIGGVAGLITWLRDE